MKLSERAVDVMARTIYAEARGELWQGKLAVGWSIRNRAEKGGWWGNTIVTVCVKSKQYSCWNDDDRNRSAMMEADLSDKAFAECYRAALTVLTNAEPDPTGGATHYHARGISPPWARGRTDYLSIGNHLFYRDID